MFWSLYSSLYSLIEIFSPYKKHQRKIFNIIAKGEKDQNILEIGPGHGYLTQQLITSGYKVDVVDVSASMLSKVKKRTGASLNIRIINADFLTAKIPEVYYDTAVMNNVLYSLSSQKIALDKITRSLKRNGRFILSDPLPSFSYGKFLIKHFTDHDDRLINLLNVILLSPFILIFALFNLVIDYRAKLKKRYRFHNIEDACTIVESSGFTILDSSLSYADQSFLIVSIKH